MSATRVILSAPVALLLSTACASDGPASGIASVGSVAAIQSSDWSAPTHLPAPINSSARELGAELSPDGLSLYFGSDRAGSIAGTVDIWVSRRECEECPWGPATPININSAKSDGGPSFSPDGHLLFFSSDRPGTLGGDDLWISYRERTDDDHSWSAPINLGAGINTADHESAPAYVPALLADGSNLYFTRGANAAADIYRARIDRDGSVLEAGVPVTELNAAGQADAEPAISHDGREIIFASTRAGGLGQNDLWVATRRSAHDDWSAPVNLGALINTRFADLTPGLSRNGRTLLWSAAAAGRPGLGLQDIWMATRVPGNGH
jgi:Tol biopolymer transport system component